MRVTADTNIVISELLWKGNPHKVLRAAREGVIELCTTEALIYELTDLLNRKRFVPKLRDAEVTARILVQGFVALATVVKPVAIEPAVIRDPDDDAVLACAVSSKSEFVVSGDDDLLALGSYGAIPIVTPAELMTALLI